jgi:hypothetical protein
MGSSINQNLLEQGLNFLGRETARQTHEITNVHNIINELSGLLGDMLAAAAGGRELDPERIGKIVTKIQEQIQRGNNLVRGLNRFAHSVDVLTGMFDLGEVAERVEFLAERHARLGKVRLKCLPPPKNVSFDGFLLGHQQLILDALDLILESDGRSNEVCIGYRIAHRAHQADRGADRRVGRALECSGRRRRAAAGGLELPPPAGRQGGVRCQTKYCWWTTRSNSWKPWPNACAPADSMLTPPTTESRPWRKPRRSVTTPSYWTWPCRE